MVERNEGPHYQSIRLLCKESDLPAMQLAAEMLEIPFRIMAPSGEQYLIAGVITNHPIRTNERMVVSAETRIVPEGFVYVEIDLHPGEGSTFWRQVEENRAKR